MVYNLLKIIFKQVLRSQNEIQNCLANQKNTIAKKLEDHLIIEHGDIVVNNSI